VKVAFPIHLELRMGTAWYENCCLKATVHYVITDAHFSPANVIPLVVCLAIRALVYASAKKELEAITVSSVTSHTTTIQSLDAHLANVAWEVQAPAVMTRDSVGVM
jgi:hypothetical protein